MSFQKAKKLVGAFTGVGLLLCFLTIIGEFVNPQMASFTSVAALGCVIVGVFLMVTCLKCPFCGKRIVRNVLVVEICPHCRRNLQTGKKKKR